MILDLNDLQPQETELRLSTKPGKVYHLKPFSLRSQIWMQHRFGDDDKIKDIFQNTRIPQICEVCHNLLKEKSDFPEFLDFAEAVVTMQDKVNLVKSLLTCIGLSQPVIEKLTKQNEKKSEPIGEPSLISSHANTAGL